MTLAVRPTLESFVLKSPGILLWPFQLGNGGSWFVDSEKLVRQSSLDLKAFPGHLSPVNAHRLLAIAFSTFWGLLNSSRAYSLSSILEELNCPKLPPGSVLMRTGSFTRCGAPEGHWGDPWGSSFPACTFLRQSSRARPLDTRRFLFD